jgi:hypothetical protein
MRQLIINVVFLAISSLLASALRVGCQTFSAQDSERDKEVARESLPRNDDATSQWPIAQGSIASYCQLANEASRTKRQRDWMLNVFSFRAAFSSGLPA